MKEQNEKIQSNKKIKTNNKKITKPKVKMVATMGHHSPLKSGGKSVLLIQPQVFQESFSRAEIEGWIISSLDNKLFG